MKAGALVVAVQIQQTPADAAADLDYLMRVAENRDRITRFYVYSFTDDANCVNQAGDCWDTALRDISTQGQDNTAGLRPAYQTLINHMAAP